MLTQRLRHRVTFQDQKESQNQSDGETLITWVDFKTDVPAEVLTGPGREFIESSAKQAETDARITTRWFPDLKQRMRVVWDGRFYNITGMETDRTGRREWRLRCVEGASDGR
ncbi:phage head closure protein [Variovorax sp.]|jgi:SPP1 family predicted phage head-tail adaptor|uniref:phage head closure protein n=1 Tax=Variovorax sp. TaxID=1871043 RepID=UPI004037D720